MESCAEGEAWADREPEEVGWGVLLSVSVAVAVGVPVMVGVPVPAPRPRGPRMEAVPVVVPVFVGALETLRVGGTEGVLVGEAV